MAPLEIQETVKELKTPPHQTRTDQPLTIQGTQTLNAQTSNFGMSEKTYAMGKQSYEECDLLTKKPLEWGSPPQHEHEVCGFACLIIKV